MPEFTVETEIDAPKRTVWSVFSGLSAYESWNPFIVDAVGTIRYDVDLALRIVTPSGSEQSFRPHVETVDVGNKVVWSTGNMLFSRETTFVLTELSPDTTKFSIDVNFEGLLARFKKGFVDELEGGYRKMAQALKERAESQGK